MMRRMSQLTAVWPRCEVSWVPLSWFRLEWALYSTHYPHFPHQHFEDFLLWDGRFFRIFFDSFPNFEVRTLSFLMFENLQSLRKLLPVQTRNSNFLTVCGKISLSLSFSTWHCDEGIALRVYEILAIPSFHVPPPPYWWGIPKKPEK